MCLEERALNRVLSGLHASVSSHLSEYYVDFDKNRKHMFANHTLYFNKVGNYNDRIKNLYYYYSVLLRAINLESKNLLKMSFNTGNESDDKFAKKLIHEILNFSTGECDKPFNE